MNKFFIIIFRILDVYIGIFRYKMYIYSYIIVREINVVICIYVYVC